MINTCIGTKSDFLEGGGEGMKGEGVKFFPALDFPCSKL